MSDPRWFPSVVGHAEAKQTLRRSLEGGRLTGSLLILGPAGVGRSLLVKRLAMATACADRQGEGPVPCGACGPCHRFEREVSGDLVVLRPEEKASIGVEQVDGLLDELALAPVESALRVFVVDPASALTEFAQNALLKGLEEPPADALLVLVASREEELLATIASRCRVLRLGELTPGQVTEVLVRQGVEPDEAGRRAAWSQGSPGQALAPDALQLAELAGEAVEAIATGSAAREPLDLADRIAAFVGTGKAEARVQRERLRRLIALLQRALRDALVLRASGRLDVRLSGASDTALRLLARGPAGALEAALDRLVEAEQGVERNANTKLLVDGLALELAR